MGFLGVTWKWQNAFAFLANFTRSWVPTRWAIFWLKVVLETWPKSTSLEPLIDLLAYLKAKLWLRNPVFDKIQKRSQKVWFALSGQILTSHNCAADSARELFKPSKAYVPNLFRSLHPFHKNIVAFVPPHFEKANKLQKQTDFADLHFLNYYS